MKKPMILKKGTQVSWGRNACAKARAIGDVTQENLHDRHEAGADGSADLVESARTSDDGHAEEVDCVLDG